MESADVLIVGGGPAGSSCAWKLRQRGVDVMILDKAQFPRHKVCAGWITPPIISALALNTADYQSQRVLQPITSFITGLIDGCEVETNYGQTVSYGIRRCEFDDYLLRRSNARLMLGETFQSARRDGTDWVVNDRIRTSVIVGAGGHFCPVAKYLQTQAVERTGTPHADAHAASSDLPVVVAQEVEFEMTAEQRVGCAVQAERPELFFCPDLKGYGWVFRKGNFLNIGLGREGESHLSTHVSEFVEFLKRRRKVTFPLPGRFLGHAYRLRTRSPRPASGTGIVLIGDSIGLADRQSGEGIWPAIDSGLICADSILEAGTSGRDQIADIYQTKLTQRFSPAASSSLAAWLPGAIRLFMARRLMASHWFTRRIVLDRWFLHRSTSE